MQNHSLKPTLFLLMGIFFSLTSLAQERYKIQKGSIDFASNAPLELIEAESTALKGVIDPLSYKLAFSVKIKSFEGFNSTLQKEHFNENYMESDKYPKATFKGKIIEQVDFDTDGTYAVRAKGDLTIHGAVQNRIIKGKLKVLNGKVMLETSFVVPLTDHDISIPKIVNKKIATEIEVTIKATMVEDEL